MADSKETCEEREAPQGLWLIAHDLKNSFALIAGAADELQHHLAAGPVAKRAFTELRWLLAHADHLGTSLLEGLRAGALERTPISLNDFLAERESSVRGSVTAGVTMTVRLAASSGVVLATETELERVLFALVSNACHAMPDGGELTISTGWLDHVSGVTHPSVRPRRYVRLTVSDTGEALDRDGHMKLLDACPDDSPAAETTRENVVSTAWRLNGWLIVEGDEQAGTRVHICLPALPNVTDR